MDDDAEIDGAVVQFVAHSLEVAASQSYHGYFWLHMARTALKALAEVAEAEDKIDQALQDDADRG